MFCLTWPNPVLDPGLSGAMQVLEVAGLGSVRAEGEGLDSTESSCSWGCSRRPSVICCFCWKRVICLVARNRES